MSATFIFVFQVFLVFLYPIVLKLKNVIFLVDEKIVLLLCAKKRRFPSHLIITKNEAFQKDKNVIYINCKCFILRWIYGRL